MSEVTTTSYLASRNSDATDSANSSVPRIAPNHKTTRRVASTCHLPILRKDTCTEHQNSINPGIILADNLFIEHTILKTEDGNIFHYRPVGTRIALSVSWLFTQRQTTSARLEFYLFWCGDCWQLDNKTSSLV